MIRLIIFNIIIQFTIILYPSQVFSYDSSNNSSLMESHNQSLINSDSLPSYLDLPYTETVIHITESGFNPCRITIQRGATVIWVNQTSMAQQIVGVNYNKKNYQPLKKTFQSSFADGKTKRSRFKTLHVPSITSIIQKIWNGGNVSSGKSILHTFNNSGINYFRLTGQNNLLCSVIVKTPINQPFKIYFEQPTVLETGFYNIDNVLIPELNLNEIDKGKFRIRIGGLGRSSDKSSVTWDVGQYTGFYPGNSTDFAKYQRGPNNHIGTSAVQARNTEVGIWLNSETNPPFQGTLLPITPATWWGDSTGYFAPWQPPRQELSYSFSLKVPTAEKHGQAQVYITAYFLFEDSVSKKSFWYGAQVFDLRPAISDTVLFDEGTQLPIILSSIGDKTNWLHKTPASSTFQQRAWNNYKYFEFRISQSEFKEALMAIRNQYPELGFSDKLTNYRVNHFNFNPEIYHPEVSQTSYNKIYIRGANASTDANMQIFFKTEDADFYSEDKSVWTSFPTGGGYNEILIDMSIDPNWKGKITGIRIDPFNTNGNFGIDYIYIGDTYQNLIASWDFDSVNPIQPDGWMLSGISNIWAHSGQWGGTGTNNDPFFFYRYKLSR